MNYQMLIESYSFGTTLSKQEIELLILELDTQLTNIGITNELGCLRSAPTYICKGLGLKKGTYWITCLAEVIDRYKKPLNGKTKGAEIFDKLLQKGLVIG
mgnify:CR=1 FL=1